METPLNYHDAVVYKRDVINFQDGNWLNDSCINFCFRWFEFSECVDKRFVLFMDPSVMSYIKLQHIDEDDISGLRKGLRLHERDYLLVPCNDNASFQSASTHWSLLLIKTATGEAHHFDSSNQTNTTAARKTYHRIKILFDW
jgi:Ulp1 family protease